MKKIIILIIALIIVIPVSAGIGGFLWLNSQLTPVDSASTEEQTFIIPSGQGSIIIGNRLAEDGFIRHPLAFRYIVWKEGLAGKIQAGSFSISPSQTTLEIAQTLTKGTEDQWVTILEGWRAEEVVEALAEFELADQTELLRLAKQNEGRLYPDTYLFPKAATAEFIISYLTNTFETKTEELQAQALSEGRDWDEVVTLASLIQREAKKPEDMKLVSGILQNRIEIGQALQVDATMQYAKGQNTQTGKWWTPPLSADKEIDSPYNTYKYPGLPPGPICNPGIEALDAAMNPTDSEYFYYLHDQSGNMYYGRTYDEHLRNIERYLR